LKVESNKVQERRGFEQLDVWKRACSLSVQLYALLKKCRDYGFRDQMQRAAVSIASNIAEGAERGSRSEFRQFLNYAKGSAAELRTQIRIASQTGILQGEESTLLIQELVEISRMLEGLRRALLKPCDL
jgi:four helix bundle protein